MEYLFEFILELVFEASIEISKNSKVPKCIRYFLIGIISLFFISVIGFIILVGILSLKKNTMLGILLILISLLLLVLSILKFKKVYVRKTTKV